MVKNFPQIGYIGLGKMGLNMVFRMLEKGYQVVGYNRTPESTKQAEKAGAIGTYSIKELAEKLGKPKVFWLMVPSDAVAALLDELKQVVSAGDTIIDGGNTYYKESMSHAAEFENLGVAYLDVGVAGGPDGARNGTSIMIGGLKAAFDQFEPLFKDLAVQNGYAYFGRSGSGHFVKMIHNGIEYGMMQAIAEGLDVLKNSEFNLNLEDAVKTYANGSVISSKLMDWLASAYKKYSQDLEDVSGAAGQLGEGAWTAKTAAEMGLRAAAISAAVEARNYSQTNPNYQGKIISVLRGEFGGHPVN